MKSASLARATTVAVVFGCGLVCNGQRLGTAPVFAAEKSADTSAVCDEYAATFCEKVGPGPVCGSVTQTSELLPVEACRIALEKIVDSFDRLTELRKRCDELANRLCADVGEETGACEMVRGETSEFPPAQCKAMLDDYASVLADLRRQTAGDAPLSAEDQKAVAAGSAAAAFGKDDAKVTVVAFSDFQCPFCSKAAAVTTEIKKKYSESVRFVFRHFPLPFHSNAHLAAQAALAAGAQGKFWEYHDVLFRNQQALGRDALEKYADQLALDMSTFKKALDEKTFAAIVDADIELGNKVVVKGTPTMFINGERAADPTDFGSVSAQIDSLLKGDGSHRR
jgi:protein-disulfide isomerase